MNILRLFFVFILCCLIKITLSAQTVGLDSLKLLLDDFNGSNKDKAILMARISRGYQGVDTAQVKKYAMDAIKIAQEEGLKGLESIINLDLTYIYNPLYNPTESDKFRMHAIEALRIVQGEKDLEIYEANAYGTLANYYMLTKEYYLSYIHLKKAEQLFLKLKSDKLITVYRNLKLLYGLINDKDNELYYSNKLLELAIEKGDTEGEIFARYSLGQLIFEETELQNALDYFLDLYQQSINFNNIKNNNLIAAVCGNIYLKLNRPHEALPYLYQVFEFSNAGERGVDINSVFPHLAEVYILLNNVDSAEFFLNKMYESFIVRDDQMESMYNLSSALDTLKGNYMNAFENYKKYHYLTDSIVKVGKTADIARMKNWYELEQKDIENELLQQEKQKQQKLLLLLSAGLLIIISLLVISIIFYRKSTKQNSELNKMHSLKDKIFSIVSHDLRSPINSLANTLKLANSLTINTENKARILKNVSSNVDNAYVLIDNLLLWSKNQIKEIRPISENFNIQNEIKLVVNDLSNIADEKFIVIDNNTQKHSIDTDINMFRVIMRNLITNAIKYSHIKGKITINSELSDNKVVISVKDRGIGMTQAIQDTLFNLPETKSALGTNNETGTGLGLVLCSEFAKKIGGKIWFDSKEGEGSTFFVALPKMS